jgi:type II secretion system protein F
MPRFAYKARKNNGEIVEGVLEADNRRLVVSKLHSMQTFPISVVEEKAGGGMGVFSREVNLKGLWSSLLESMGMSPVSRREISNFTRQMSDLLRSGLTLAKALEVLVQQAEDERLRGIIKDLRSEVQGGATFSDALGRHPKVFPELYRSMIRAGEVGGLLDEVLERLADFEESELETRSRIMSALAYPAIMAMVGAVVIVVLVTFVIPRFKTMFEDMDQGLPVMTLILVQVSAAISKYWWAGLAILAAGIIAYKKLVSQEEERARIDAIKLKVPVLGDFILKNEVGRFSRTLGILLANGVPILRALDITRAVVRNGVIAQEVNAISDNIREGERLSERLEESGVFPPVAVNMVAVGEETGSLETTLLRVATTYEKETERALKTLTTLIEPLMILVMGAVVGFIVMAMILPIFQLSTGMAG